MSDDRQEEYYANDILSASDIVNSTYKRRMKESKLPIAHIDGLKVTIISSEDARKMKVVSVTKLTEEVGGEGSIYDSKMGDPYLRANCGTCANRDCHGHFGLIEFNGLIILNPVLADLISKIFAIYCPICATLKVQKSILIHEGLMKSTGFARIKALYDRCSNISCLDDSHHYVNADKGIKFNIKGKSMSINGLLSYKSKSDNIRSIMEKLGGKGTMDDKHDFEIIHFILQDLDRNGAGKELGFSPETKLASLIMDCVLISPPVTRGTTMTDGRDKKNLNKLFKQIISITQTKTRDVATRKEAMNALFQAVKAMQVGSAGSKSDEMSISKILQAKKGAYRKQGIGKACFQIGRSPLGPLLGGKVSEVGVPNYFETNLNENIAVTKYNLEMVKKDIANKIISPIMVTNRDLSRTKITEKTTYTPEAGEIITRKLKTGDVVNFNRQPSLHRGSIKGFNVKMNDDVLQTQGDRNIKIHIVVTPGFNADFDGDEGNIQKPTNNLSKIENSTIMHFTNNYTSLMYGKPEYGLAMDAVLASTMMTDDRTYVPLQVIINLFSGIRYKRELLTLAERLEKYKVPFNTGKAVFSALLPSDFYYNKDGVLIIDGIMLKGTLKKKTIGRSDNGTIGDDIATFYGGLRNNIFLTDATTLLTEWVTNYGYTISYLNCTMYTTDENNNVVDYAKLLTSREVSSMMENVNKKMQLPEKSKVRKEAKEKSIVASLDISSSIGNVIIPKYMIANINHLIQNENEGRGLLYYNKENYDRENPIFISTLSGAKGDVNNISKIMWILGQLFLKTKRLPLTVNNNRFHPGSIPYDNGPESRGFVNASYKDGLDAVQSFAASMSAREALADSTAIPVSGEIQSKIYKAMGNIMIDINGAVVSTNGYLIQLVYGGCGMAVDKCKTIDNGLTLERTSFIDIEKIANGLCAEQGWVKGEIVPQRENEDSVKIKSVVTKHIDAITSGYYSPYRQYKYEVNLDRPSYKRLSKYEMIKLIGTRADMLDDGSEPMLKLEELGTYDHVKVATRELQQGRLPLGVVRARGEGKVEYIRPFEDYLGDIEIFNSVFPDNY